MSKFQLPTQKGTELFPQTMQAPTKVVFEGVPPGSPLARELYVQHAAQISNFHRQQAQKYSLSVVENYRAHGRAPGLEMTYTNLQGHETLQVRVTATEGGSVTKTTTDEPPDFVVIDIEIMNSAAVYGRFAARLVQPEMPPAPESTLAWEEDDGSAFNSDYSTWTEFPIIEYATIEEAEGSDGVTNRVSSLKVDMRRLSPRAHIEIDIWGDVTPDEYPIIGYEPGGWYVAGESTTGVYSLGVVTFTVDYKMDGPPYSLLNGWTISISDPGLTSEPMPRIIAALGDFSYPFPDVWETGIVTAFGDSVTYHVPSGLVQVLRLLRPDPEDDEASYPQLTNHEVLETWEAFFVTHEVHYVNTYVDKMWGEVITYDIQQYMDPIYGDSYATPAKVYGRFYKHDKLKSLVTAHEYPAAVWSAGNVWSRGALLADITMTDQPAPTTPPVYRPYLGRVIIDRWPAVAGFRPA